MIQDELMGASLFTMRKPQGVFAIAEDETIAAVADRAVGADVVKLLNA
jgi:hypothetical protein